MNTYLLEIGLEELPAPFILPGVNKLEELVKVTLEQHSLAFTSIQKFSTPRRLAVVVSGLPEKQEDQIREIKGPPAKIAKDEQGQWSKAALGFAKKNAVEVDQLGVKEFQGQDYLFITQEVKGQATTHLLEMHAPQWITSITFPKNMRWGWYKMRYARPIRWVCSLWNNQLLPVSLEMKTAAKTSQGHRFLAPESFAMIHAEQYQKQLKQAYVLVDFDQRKELIVAQIRELENKHGFHVQLDEDLLTEVTNLVEWPTALVGNFEEAFLQLPSEVLVTSMAKHQRYFPVYDAQGTLLPHFVTVRNGNDRSLELVKQGNMKVLRARLSDARFFYFEDQKHELSFFNKKLNKVVFFNKRGTVTQRVNRIEELSDFIAEQLAFSQKQKKEAMRIAQLCKFDLQTQMVMEFPKLQGIMGERYARIRRETEVVCRGIRDHYAPRTLQEALPQDLETVPAALADRLDMLVTAFSLKLDPSGSEDPYALRRMAQGLMQLIYGYEIRIPLDGLIAKALQILIQQQGLTLDSASIRQNLLDFMELRQRFLMKQANIRHDVIEALLKGTALLPVDQLKLADMLKDHLDSPLFKKAVESIVRANNISQQQSALVPTHIEKAALELPEEKTFWKQVQSLPQKELNLDHYLLQVFELVPIITQFFDKVMVMDENPVKQRNRLFLCHILASWSRQYLDLKEIVFAKEGSV
ncbi:glycine--tRNA ligase subunit beta [Deltaproteobacteria bacterium TL4]